MSVPAGPRLSPVTGDELRTFGRPHEEHQPEGGSDMKLAIEDFCIRCGICIAICPDLYEMDYEGDVITIKVEEVPEALMEKAKEAIRECAVGSIHFVK